MLILYEVYIIVILRGGMYNAYFALALLCMYVLDFRRTYICPIGCLKPE